MKNNRQLSLSAKLIYKNNRSGNLFVKDELLDLHSKIEGCALCQTDVPCESEIPVIKVIDE